MKILNVLLDNNLGGPQNRVLSIARGLNKYGIETIILTSREKGEFADQSRRESFKTYQIVLYGPKHLTSFYSLIDILKWLISFPISIYEIISIIRLEKVDIVQTNGLINLQAPIASFIMKKKLVWCLSSSLFPQYVVSLLIPLVEILSDKIVVIAERLKPYYFGRSSDLPKVSVIYGCIDVNKFNPKKISQFDINKTKSILNIHSKEFVVGCVGNISPAKGYEYFLKCCYLIKKEIKTVKFVIVGIVPPSQKLYYEKLQNMIKDLHLEKDVIFAGKSNDIPKLISIFDVFVLSSISEGGPRVTVEAMAMEVPVVATDVGAVSEQIENYKNGVIVSPSDEKALANAIIALLNNPIERHAIGKNGRKRVETSIPIERCVEEYKNLYNSLLVKL